jgi:adenine-specific DNA glycosylase
VFSRVFGLGFLPGDGAAHKRAYWDVARLWVDAGQKDAWGEDSDNRVTRPGALNEALMELGATICIPKSPRCGACPLSPKCLSRRQGWTEILPPLKPRARIEVVAATAVLAIHRGALLTETRKPGSFLAGHAMVPLFLGDEAPEWRTLFSRRVPGWEITAAARTGSVRHTIMSKRYDVSVWEIEVRPVSPKTFDTSSSRGGVKTILKSAKKKKSKENQGESPTGLSWLRHERVDEALTNAFARKLWATSRHVKVA